MPVVRGTVHELRSDGTRTVAALVISNDRWNAAMSQVAVLAVRTELLEQEREYGLAFGRSFITAARPLAVLAPPDADSPLGPAVAGLSVEDLQRVEERLCAFLQLPALLLGAAGPMRPTGDTSGYPLWGEIYRGPVLAGERKRFVVVSPNEWNAVAGLATGVRTTSRLKIDDAWFPRILGGETRACCGDTTTFPLREWRLARRDRPTPFTATTRDMVAIARGLADVYELGDALSRLGRGAPPTGGASEA